jgi:hypothetical protein
VAGESQAKKKRFLVVEKYREKVLFETGKSAPSSEVLLPQFSFLI